MSRHKGGYTLTKSARSASGEVIEERRMSMNLSIQQVARQADLSAPTVSLIERIGVMNTKVNTLMAICKVLNLNPLELIAVEMRARK